jgi:hypothetical protein
MTKSKFIRDGEFQEEMLALLRTMTEILVKIEKIIDKHENLKEESK